MMASNRHDMFVTPDGIVIALVTPAATPPVPP
jgi:hypothetical protein